ncbi:acyl carrier protein phosphodiesterase [Arcicella rigui]|uniref:ACP phosphodiesterase n=1 Tax=Arcicella rigui TaxID=797020 RepID=A0ABU5Q665_9BACT|nr:ACP phosphodiesterase [Arcicella rigui]MEA5138088.1 ACP phosphodiesterase [Arcicella rigui]
MNFLAHIYLSGDNNDIKIGNFLGDFVKGNLDNIHNSHIKKEVLQGIALHRAIDSFTDSHEVVKQSIERLHPKYHKFSGIVVDMFYDHIFAKNFSEYSSIPLTAFSQTFYQLLIERKEEIPKSMDRLVNSMISRDWLSNYANYEGIEWSLRGISQRLKFKSGIEFAVEDLKNDYELYKKEFDIFFPTLINYCQVFLAQQKNA